MATTHQVVVIDDTAQRADTEASRQFLDIIDRAVDSSEPGLRVAFDCEGVNLCRVGTVEIVSLCFDDALYEGTERTIFLVDLNDESDTELLGDRVAALKKLFESDNVLKVIHDCRMDCDALHHLHGIDVQNVHDTSCFHIVEDRNLNEVLQYYGLTINYSRDSSVYKVNPRHWATRPMTPAMRLWASSDVEMLLRLAEMQLQRMSATEMVTAQRRSEAFARVVVDMGLEQNVPLRSKAPGLFIGRKGASLQALQRRTGTMIYKDYDHGGQTAEVWLVYYPDASALAQVKRAMGA